VLQFYDPGVITRENVNSYLALFPYDRTLYAPKFCRTLLIPAVARSRFCQYTDRRIAKYDHYCPWMLAPVGLRTHRFFLLFLITNDLAAAYYAVGCWKHLRWELSGLAVPWSGRFWADVRLGAGVCIQFDPFVAGIFFVLAGVVLFMTGFIGQQLWYTAKNVTQIEIDRIEEWHEENPGAVYVHQYDRGFVQNLREDWFPPKAAKHAPVPLCKPPNEEERVKEKQSQEEAAPTKRSAPPGKQKRKVRK
jgi:hypothetical protein